MHAQSYMFSKPRRFPRHYAEALPDQTLDGSCIADFNSFIRLIAMMPNAFNDLRLSRHTVYVSEHLNTFLQRIESALHILCFENEEENREDIVIRSELGAFMRTEFLCISVLRVASGPRVKLVSCKSALNPAVVCSTDRSKAVVPVLILLFVALWFILRGYLLYAFPCVILFWCFSVLLVLRLPRLGEERANLSAFRTFVRFVLV